MSGADIAPGDTDAARLRALADRFERAVVLVHVPKTGGVALQRTALMAGWLVVRHDDQPASRGACPYCQDRRCDRGAPWGDGLTGAATEGLFVSVGHRPVDVGLEAAAVLAATGCEVRVVMSLRDAEDRLRSAFRYYWRSAFEGGMEPLARAVGTGSRRALATRLAPTAGRRLVSALGRTHAARVRGTRAVDALHYARYGHGRLTIDGAAWLAAFERHGDEGIYWLDQVVGDPQRLRRLRDAGRIRLVRPDGLDRFTRDVLGVPAVRANVSMDGARPEVERALEAAADEVRRIAGRDAPFAGLIAEAGA